MHGLGLGSSLVTTVHFLAQCAPSLWVASCITTAASTGQNLALFPGPSHKAGRGLGLGRATHHWAWALRLTNVAGFQISPRHHLSSGISNLFEGTCSYRFPPSLVGIVNALLACHLHANGDSTIQIWSWLLSWSMLHVTIMVTTYMYVPWWRNWSQPLAGFGTGWQCTFEIDVVTSLPALDAPEKCMQLISLQSQHCYPIDKYVQCSLSFNTNCAS